MLLENTLTAAVAGLSLLTPRDVSPA
jgi:hypothetical protein